MMDIEPLVREISPEEPCGANLEYDPEFGVLERTAEYQPERQLGDLVEPAKPPDWREVRKQAQRLLVRTKDLRVAVYLAQALLRLEGVQGLRDGLALLRALLERYWDQVHPQLDPEEDYDPTLRMNALAPLVDRESGLRALREVELVSAPGLGHLALRDLDIAAGRIPAPAQMPERPTLSLVDAVFTNAPLEGLQASAAAVEEARGHLEAIGSLLVERVGSESAPDFAPLAELLSRIDQTFAERLAKRIELTGGAGESLAGESPGKGLQPMRGVVESREQVVALLDQICDYFRRQEPSSPIPLLLERAKRLVNKSFMEAIRDLAPDGLRQVEAIRGPLDQESD